MNINELKDAIHNVTDEPLTLTVDKFDMTYIEEFIQDEKLDYIIEDDVVMVARTK